MGRLKYGYLRCPPGFKDKMRRRVRSVSNVKVPIPEVVVEKKYVVPDGMLNAVMCEISHLRTLRREDVKSWLEAALKWLAENPIIPSRSQVDNMVAEGTWDGTWMAVEWQRRMFINPEAEVPSRISAAIRGTTLTPEQGERIIDMVRMCVRHKPRPAVQNLE